jgi:hypothetical protein
MYISEKKLSKNLKKIEKGKILLAWFEKEIKVLLFFLF